MVKKEKKKKKKKDVNVDNVVTSKLIETKAISKYLIGSLDEIWDH